MSKTAVDDGTNALPEDEPDTGLLLQLKGVEVVYHHAALAIQGISMDVPDGSIVTLLGTNGAGKTTTLKAISGFLGAEDARVTEGQILFNRRDITGWQPYRTARLGVSLVQERNKVFESLTVQDNLNAVSTSSSMADRTDLVFDRFPALKTVRNSLAGYLSGGERQMLAMSVALLQDPKLLLVDELSLGLAPKVIDELMQHLYDLHQELGLTILLVEQSAAAALQVADYGYVIEDGRIVFSGTTERLLSHGDVKEFYLGMSDAAGERRSYRQVKQYRRKRRWWG